MNLFKQQAKRAMTTRGQKSCLVIDHLVEALAGDPSSNLRRAIILTMIDESPGITQTEIMHKIDITKSAMNREIDWLFNYGCIVRQDDEKDGRAVRLEICGYSKRALESALDYFPRGHESLIYFLEQYINILKQERPTLRDARIIATLHDQGKSQKSKVADNLYNGPATTDNRAIKQLIDNGVIQKDE